MIKFINTFAIIGVLIQLPVPLMGIIFLLHSHGPDSGFTGMVLLGVLLVCCLIAAIGFIFLTVSLILMKRRSADNIKSIEWIHIPFKIDLALFVLCLFLTLVLWK